MTDYNAQRTSAPETDRTLFVALKCPECQQEFSMKLSVPNGESATMFLKRTLDDEFFCPRCRGQRKLSDYPETRSPTIAVHKFDSEAAHGQSIDTMEKFEQLRNGDFDDYQL
jgi:rubredoxin